MSRKTAMDAIFSAPVKAPEKLGTPNAPSQAPSPPRIRSGAIAAMGASLQQLTEIRDQVEAGSAIVELDTDLIDGSFVSDRMADATDASIESLAESIRESGQQVPILVRPHPDGKGRYQIAFGHRRVRAATRLGIKVRAVVRDLSDQELVVAQGKENLDRRDLSFIEKAFFALHLEALNFDRAVIMQALSTDKGDLSRYIAVAKAIPENIARVIGPAPKAGRARWIALADALTSGPARRAVESVISEPDFPGLDSDSRFARVLSAATRKPPVENAPSGRRGTQTISTASGRKIARVNHTGRDLKISVDKGFDADFAAYLVEQLPALAEAYAKARGEGTS
ncbi:plasmid partitioning protein RepB [Microvirga makkahensis]|uniref:Plasmid partitioning protein RepB n=1 Tax=Microvirga makkahensis TaxID=1128670 RepID=A0A7X3MU89_9HYPH|nr:plasmid partitioning protein RepB [Microvirga makkahensis]MXQ13361.1 plasmid partitioning protein RepB [Microvirga makkahensis]